MKQTDRAPLILLVDDEEEILFSASLTVKKAVNSRVVTLSCSTDVMPFLKDEEPALIVLDLFMPVISGQELLLQILNQYPDIPVIIMTASTAIENAIDCMKNGAFDYLVKPVEKGRLASSVMRALETRRLKKEIKGLKDRLLSGNLQNATAFEGIVTQHPKMKAIFQYLESIAPCSDQPVLITGETGTGKELIARAVHSLSGRSGRFVAVNVAGLDDLVFSDTLFGHRKGAYTGADQAREGLISQAADGTLFLDETGDLQPASQIKLLRVLQEQEYYPLGSDVAKRSKARIVAASNCDLMSAIDGGSFRRDLYYRLCTHNCRIPPLRERVEDIPVLFRHFLEQAASAQGKQLPQYHSSLPAMLENYPFPGNVRELQAMVFDAVARHTSGPLSAEAFLEKTGLEPPALQQIASRDASFSSANGFSMHFESFPTIKEVEDTLVRQALELSDGKQGTAAAMLGLTRQALNNRLVRARNH